MNNINATIEIIKPDEEYRIVNYSSKITRKGYELSIHLNGDKFYFFNGQRHRENAPAIIWVSGYQVWYIHYKRHRLNGPALIYSNGEKEYYIDGKYCEENEYYKELTKCRFCKYQSKNKENLFVHYDYEEEKGNLICQQMLQYIEKLKY